MCSYFLLDYFSFYLFTPHSLLFSFYLLAKKFSSCQVDFSLHLIIEINLNLKNWVGVRNGGLFMSYCSFGTDMSYCSFGV